MSFCEAAKIIALSLLLFPASFLNRWFASRDITSASPLRARQGRRASGSVQERPVEHLGRRMMWFHHDCLKSSPDSTNYIPSGICFPSPPIDGGCNVIIGNRTGGDPIPSMALCFPLHLGRRGNTHRPSLPVRPPLLLGTAVLPTWLLPLTTTLRAPSRAVLAGLESLPPDLRFQPNLKIFSQACIFHSSLTL